MIDQKQKIQSILLILSNIFFFFDGIDWIVRMIKRNKQKYFLSCPSCLISFSFLTGLTGLTG